MAVGVPKRGHERFELQPNVGGGLFSGAKILLLMPLPAERLVLILIPGECVLKMPQFKIWPIFIPDIKIRINRLHREKTAQSASSSPTHNQIQA